MTRTLPVLLSLALLAGCGGVDTLAVKTVPSGAQLHVNGKSVGATPRSIPSRWAIWPFSPNIVLHVQKPGYATHTEIVTPRKRWRRLWNADHTAGSAFGWGQTYPYTFTLQKAD